MSRVILKLMGLDPVLASNVWAAVDEVNTALGTGKQFFKVLRTKCPQTAEQGYVVELQMETTYNVAPGTGQENLQPIPASMIEKVFAAADIFPSTNQEPYAFIRRKLTSDIWDYLSFFNHPKQATFFNANNRATLNRFCDIGLAFTAEKIAIPRKLLREVYDLLLKVREALGDRTSENLARAIEEISLIFTPTT